MNDDERAVLADELQLRGDPQGELIALQLALAALPATAAPERRTDLERTIEAYLDHHHDALYGPLAPYVDRLSTADVSDLALRVDRWHAGFIDTAWILRPRSGIDIIALLRALRALPIGRYVRRLEIGYSDHPAALAELAREPWPELRELVLGAHGHDFHRVTLTNTAPLDPILGQLELLAIHCGIVLLPMTAPALRRLEIYNQTDPFPDGRVFDPALPALEDLVCYGFRLDTAFVDRFPKLRNLAIHTRQFDPGWFEHFVRSPMLARLESLKISTLGEDALHLIAAERERFEHLTRLDLENNFFSVQIREQVADRMPACVRYR